jgi:hypothetical protein
LRVSAQLHGKVRHTITHVAQHHLPARLYQPFGRGGTQTRRSAGNQKRTILDLHGTLPVNDIL